MTVNKVPWYEIPSDDIPLVDAVRVPDGNQNDESLFHNNMTITEEESCRTAVAVENGVVVVPIRPIRMTVSSSPPRPRIASTGSFEVHEADSKSKEETTPPTPSPCMNRKDRQELKRDIARELKSVKREAKKSWKEVKRAAKEEWKAEKHALRSSARDLKRSLKNIDCATKEEAEIWKAEIQKEAQGIKDKVSILKEGVMRLVRQTKLEMNSVTP